MTENIDKTAAVESARAWAQQLRDWPKCGMLQGLMANQIIAAAIEPSLAIDAYDRLCELAAEWRRTRIARPTRRSSEQMLWMIEQLEICLGILVEG